MPAESLARAVPLPELRLLRKQRDHWGKMIPKAEKTPHMEVYPKCATPSTSVYDRRWIHINDEPIQKHPVRLWLCKRRFLCPCCRRPFTEPVQGVRKGYRTTERYRK
jgi:transposase